MLLTFRVHCYYEKNLVEERRYQACSALLLLPASSQISVAGALSAIAEQAHHTLVCLYVSIKLWKPPYMRI
jgi:hypothetical protein